MNKPWFGCVRGSKTHQLQINRELILSKFMVCVCGCGHQREWYVFLPVHRTCCEPRSTGHQTTPRSPARAAAPQPAQTFKHNDSESAPKQVDRPRTLVHTFKCHIINQDFHIIPSDDLHQGSQLGAESCFILLCSCWQESVRRLRPRDLPSFLLQLSLRITWQVQADESDQPCSMALVCLGVSSSPAHLNRDTSRMPEHLHRRSFQPFVFVIFFFQSALLT